MADICTLCAHEFQNFPRIELACHHSFHTHCFLTNIATTNPEHLFFLPCSTCEQPIFAQQEELEQDIEEETQGDNESVHSNHSVEQEQTRVSNLYDTNEAFRKDIQTYVKATRGVSKPRLAFQRLLKTKKTELLPTYTQIKAQYEGLYHTKKDEIVSSQEYKTFKSAEAKQSRYWYLLIQKYNITSRGLWGLRGKRGCKTIHRPFFWRNSPNRLIRKALRLRLPHW